MLNSDILNFLTKKTPKKIFLRILTLTWKSKFEILKIAKIRKLEFEARIQFCKDI